MLTMKNFIDGDIAVYCESKDEAVALLDRCQESDLKWISGRAANEFVDLDFPVEIAYGAVSVMTNISPIFGCFFAIAGKDVNSLTYGEEKGCFRKAILNVDKNAKKRFFPVDALDFLADLKNGDGETEELLKKFRVTKEEEIDHD